MASELSSRALDVIPDNAPELVWRSVDEPFAHSAALLTLMEMPTCKWFRGGAGWPLLRDVDGQLKPTGYCLEIVTKL